MSAIRLIVGLGNPGPEHEDDRHNAGFRFVDALAHDCAASLSRESRFFGFVGRAQVGAASVYLLKPSTWMNRSGQAVLALAVFYRILPEQILVVYDELDLLPGQARLKRGGGAAGHNGVRDIQARLGSGEFWRLRLGIGHPRTLGLNQQVADFVLHRPSREDRQAIDDAIERALQCLPAIVEGDPVSAMSKLHVRERDGRESGAQRGPERDPESRR